MRDAGRTPTKEEDTALSLTLAVVASANSPLVLLDGDLNIVGASRTFCKAFGVDVPPASGMSFFELGVGEWDRPELRAFLDAAASGKRVADTEFDLVRPAAEVRHLLLHVERLEYLDLDQVRLLMAVTDATAALAADKKAEELRQHNAMLVQEARHRVANSLQIIASVLMQHARKTQSEETRTQLNSAHQRVMSVAALERHLAGSGAEHVEVGPYLVKLCENIAASMIADPARVALEVISGRGVVPANVSVSLGLITTETVINAIKYAFSDGRPGKILVSYELRGSDWTLSIRDNGVGFPTGIDVVAGLGTSIVQALAMQLNARVVIDRDWRGASVSIVHSEAGRS